MPGSPAASWAVYRARLKAVFDGADPRVCAAFWLFGTSKPAHVTWEARAVKSFHRLDSTSATSSLPPSGLINNVLYVIILSAALDLVGPNVPKGVVLLADVIPSFFTKLCAPYFIQQVPYHARVLVFVALSALGMLVIALTPADQDARTIGIKMAGVILASLSSGGGELSFLGLTHYYGHFALAAWGSGTGGAGLVGAGAYAIATTSLGISPRTSLLAFAFLPVIMLITFFLVLPRGPLRASAKSAEYEPIGDEDADEWGNDASVEARSRGGHVGRDGLLASSMHSSCARSLDSSTRVSQAWRSFKANLRRSRGLFFP